MSVFPRKLYTVKTKSSGSFVKGKWVDGTESSTTYSLNCQPVTGKELETLSIGAKNIGKIKVYGDIELNITDEKTQQVGDKIVFFGKDYELISKEKWQSDLINHYKYYGELRLEE